MDQELQNATEITRRLIGEPLRTVECAHFGDPPPQQPGVYAWWVDVHALPAVPTPTRRDDGFRLLYVGIAPRNATSHSTLHARILRQHIRGNINSSTFRFGLAALLEPEFGWIPIASGKKLRLEPADNEALSKWQREHLRVSWLEFQEPWKVEAAVINEMKPPMNRAHNSAHPFYARMGEERETLARRAA